MRSLLRSACRNFIASSQISIAGRPFMVRMFSAAQVLSRQDVEEKVLTIVRNFDRTNLSRLSINSQFTSDLGLDSLDVVEVMIAMEEQFHMEIPDAIADKIKSPGEVVDYVYKKLNPDEDEAGASSSQHH